MTDNNAPTRRTVLKSIGSGATAVTTPFACESAQATSEGSGGDGIHSETIQDDLDVFNRTSEPNSVTVEIINPDGETIESYTYEVGPNPSSGSENPPYVTEERIPQMNGRKSVKASTNQYENSENLHIPPAGKRTHQMLSISVLEDGITVGKTEI
jgi:hypothetical protein